MHMRTSRTGLGSPALQVNDIEQKCSLLVNNFHYLRRDLCPLEEQRRSSSRCLSSYLLTWALNSPDSPWHLTSYLSVNCLSATCLSFRFATSFAYYGLSMDLQKFGVSQLTTQGRGCHGNVGLTLAVSTTAHLCTSRTYFQCLVRSHWQNQQNSVHWK